MHAGTDASAGARGVAAAAGSVLGGDVRVTFEDSLNDALVLVALPSGASAEGLLDVQVSSSSLRVSTRPDGATLAEGTLLHEVRPPSAAELAAALRHQPASAADLGMSSVCIALPKRELRLWSTLFDPARPHVGVARAVVRVSVGLIPAGQAPCCVRAVDLPRNALLSEMHLARMLAAELPELGSVPGSSWGLKVRALPLALSSRSAVSDPGVPSPPRCQ